MMVSPRPIRWTRPAPGPETTLISATPLGSPARLPWGSCSVSTDPGLRSTSLRVALLSTARPSIADVHLDRKAGVHAGTLRGVDQLGHQGGDRVVRLGIDQNRLALP